MIRLTRLNGSQFWVNAEQIQTVEASPDTHLVMTNGAQYVVREPAQAVAGLMMAYKRQVHAPDWMAGGPAQHRPGGKPHLRVVPSRRRRRRKA